MNKVRQRPLGCLPACISMLSGIDYEMLPNVTTKLVRLTVMDVVEIETDRYHEVSNNQVSVDWLTFRHYYAFNYGLDIRIHFSRPDRDAVLLAFNGTHAVVETRDGRVIDPDEHNRPRNIPADDGRMNLWLTVRPIGEI